MTKTEKKKVFEYIWKKQGREKNLKGEKVILYLTNRGTTSATLDQISDSRMKHLSVIFGLSKKSNKLNPRKSKVRKKTATRKKPASSRRKTTKKKKWSIQSVIFLKKKWTRPKAAKWLREHGYKAVKPDGDGEYWRYRQSAPSNFSKFRTFPFGGKGLGIKAVYGDVKRGKKLNPAGKDVDEYAATELKLFVENDADLYRQQFIPIIKNLVRKKAAGIYDHEKAIKLFMYLMESGAKKYNKEFGSGRWYDMFNVPTRKAAAKEFVETFEKEYSYGNWDHYIPKKYQKKTSKKKKNASRLKVAKQKRRAGKKKSTAGQIPNFVAILGRPTDIKYIGGQTSFDLKKHFLVRDGMMLVCNVSGKKLFMFPKRTKSARAIQMSKGVRDARKMFKKWAGFASGHETLIGVPDVSKWILMGHITRIDYICSREGKAYYHPFKKTVRVYFAANDENVYKIEPVRVTSRGIEDP